MSHTAVRRRQLRERDIPKSSSAMSSASSSSSGVKMRTRLSTGTLIMNGTCTVKERDTWTPSSTTGLDSSAKAQKDTPTIGSKRQAASVEAATTVPLKKQRITKSDGSRTDLYCWVCQKDDCNIACEFCPRSFHLKCLSFQTPPEDWVCGECEKIMQAERKDTHSSAKKMISTDELSFLLLCALDRMRQPENEVFQKPVDPADLPTYRDVVTYPVDFEMLEKKIKKKMYGCTVAFLAEVMWIRHNCIIFNGMHHKLTAVAKQVVKICKHEMTELEVCPQCYKHSCIYQSDGFIHPCNPPHPLVWAKLKGYPFWPAKVMNTVNGCVDVRFFGAHDKSLIRLDQVFKLSKDPPVAMKHRKGGFAFAMNEMEKHISAIRHKCGTFSFAPIHTRLYSEGEGHMYRSSKLKEVNLKSAKHFKKAAHGRFSAKDAEKVSATSKTASAVKSKYTSFANKKSTTTAALRQGQGLEQQVPIHLRGYDSSPETAEKAVRRALSDCGKTSVSKSFFINPTVAVTDIIQEKNLMQRQMEIEGEEETEDLAEEHGGLSSEDAASEGEGAEGNNKEKQTEKEGTTSETVTQETVNNTTKDKVSEENNHQEQSEGEGSGKEEIEGTAEGQTEKATREKNKEKDWGNEGTVEGTDMTNKVQTTDKEGEVVKGEDESDQVGSQDTRIGEEEDESELKSTPLQETIKDDSLQENSEGDSLPEKTVEEIDSMTLEDSESSCSMEIYWEEESNHSGKFSEETTELEQDCSSSPSPSVSEAVPPTDREKEPVQKCRHSKGEPSSVIPPPASPSLKSGSKSVTSEISPQSGTQYKDSLSKTIEACKDKLGIANVEEIEEPVDVSDDEESLHSKDDDKRVDNGPDNLADSQMSADSEEDSRVSSETEENSASCATDKTCQKSDSETGGGKTSQSEVDCDSGLGTTEIVFSSASERQERRSQSPAVSASLVQKAAASAVPSDPVTDSLVQKAAASALPSDPVTDVSVSVSEKATPLPKSLSLGVKEKAALVSQSPGSDEVRFVLLKKMPQDQSSSSASCEAGVVSKMGNVNVIVTSRPFTSQCDTAAYTAVKICVPSGSSESSSAQAASVLGKPSAGQFRLVSLLNPPSRVSVSNLPSVPSSGVSLLKTYTSGTSKTVPSVRVTMTDPICRTEHAVTTVSSKITLLSSQSASKSSDQTSVVTSKTLTGTTSKEAPITIIDDDDDEPDLLMEVESDVEHDDPLVIDLEEENLKRSEGETTSSQKSNSSRFVKTMAPSPGVLKNISQVRDDSLRKSVHGPVKAKPKKSLEASTSSSLPGSAWMVSSEPSSCETLMISDVRSLSGTVHDWREDSGMPSSSEPNPPQQQLPQQPQQQSLLLPQQQLPQQPQQQSLLLPQQQPLQQQQPQQAQQQSQQQPSQQLQQQPLQQSQQQPLQQSQQQPLQQSQQQPLQQPQPQLQSAPGPSDSLLSQALQNFRMTVPLSRRRSDGNLSNSSSERPSEEPAQALTPAAVNLVNKYSQQIVGNMQLQLAEMCKELLKSVRNERESEERLNEVKAQLQWTHEQQLAEIKYNNKLALAEMKTCWEAEKSKALSDLKKKMTQEKEAAVAETKKNQWCASCWKEALYYCCWNTSYCSYTCQTRHWELHQNECRQVEATADSATTTTTFTTMTTPTTTKDDRNQGDLWRNQLAQNIQFLPSQQIRPGSLQVQRQPQPPTQALQHFQYLHSLRANTPAVFQNTPQVQLLGQRPAASSVMSRSVMPGHTMVFPILRSSQPGSVPCSQNLVFNQHLQYQPLWKN